MNEDWLDYIQWNDQGLVPAIAQETGTGTVLMMAWMNREALASTRRTGHAVYWSRSRNRLWHKGEESGHQQIVHAIRTDCDADVILLEVEQKGGIACHTGRHNCFFRALTESSGEGPERDPRPEEPHREEPHWEEVEPVLKDPAAIYGKP